MQAFCEVCTLKVTFFYQHFWPDSPPYASMLRSIGEELVRSGHSVNLVTGHPSYKSFDFNSKNKSQENINGIEVVRLRSLPLSNRFSIIKNIQKAIFPVRGFFHLVVKHVFYRERTDVIVAATIPPIVNGLCSLAAARLTGAYFVYHIQDIYPEIGAVGGMWNENSFRHKILKRLDRFVCLAADRCVVLSADMRNSLLSRGVEPSQIRIINNFQLEAHDLDETPKTDPKLSEAVTSPSIVFAGNLGRFQGLDLLLDGFLLWSKSRSLVKGAQPLTLHFLGDGVVKSELIKRAEGSSCVQFHGHLPFSEAAGFIRQCDVGIVSVSPEVYKYAYPSKTLTYLGLGIAVFAIVESESSLAKEIESNKIGIVCGSRNLADVVEAFDRLCAFINNKQHEPIGVEVFHDRFLAPSVVFAAWGDLLSEFPNKNNHVGT